MVVLLRTHLSRVSLLFEIDFVWTRAAFMVLHSDSEIRTRMSKSKRKKKRKRKRRISIPVLIVFCMARHSQLVVKSAEVE